MSQDVGNFYHRLTLNTLHLRHEAKDMFSNFMIVSDRIRLILPCQNPVNSRMRDRRSSCRAPKTDQLILKLCLEHEFIPCLPPPYNNEPRAIFDRSV